MRIDADEWQLTLIDVLLFVGAHKRLPATTSPEPHERRLARWVSVQKTAHRNRRLPRGKVSALENIPGWTWEGQKSGWQASYESVMLFVKENGRVPQYQKEHSVTEKQLARWVRRQQIAYRNQKILPERLPILESIPGWTWVPLVPAAPTWEDSCESVKLFVESHARFPRAVMVGAAERGLRKWVDAQRAAHQDKTLPQEKVSALEAITGWTWNRPVSTTPTISAASRWEDSYESLKLFVEWNARLPRTQKAGAAEKQLRKWVGIQKSNYKNKNLSWKRAAALEKIPGWTWGLAKSSWQDSYDSLKFFVELHGRYPRRENANRVELLLYQWVKKQQSAYQGSGGANVGEMSPDRIAELERLPGWKWVIRQHRSWEASLTRLKMFYIKHERWPRRSATQLAERRLSLWVNTQRQQYRSESPYMTAERISALESVPGWQWSPK